MIACNRPRSLISTTSSQLSKFRKSARSDLYPHQSQDSRMIPSWVCPAVSTVQVRSVTLAISRIPSSETRLIKAYTLYLPTLRYQLSRPSSTTAPMFQISQSSSLANGGSTTILSSWTSSTLRRRRFPSIGTGSPELKTSSWAPERPRKSCRRTVLSSGMPMVADRKRPRMCLRRKSPLMHLSARLTCRG